MQQFFVVLHSNWSICDEKQSLFHIELNFNEVIHFRALDKA